MTIVDPAALQAFCAFATLVLTVYVAWRDTKQMKSEETRRNEAEMLAQPSSSLHGLKGVPRASRALLYVTKVISPYTRWSLQSLLPMERAALRGRI